MLLLGRGGGWPVTQWREVGEENKAHLLLGAQVVEHASNLCLPVLLQGVEGFQGHLKHRRLLNRLQLLQDADKVWPGMWIWAPALCRGEAQELGRGGLGSSACLMDGPAHAHTCTHTPLSWGRLQPGLLGSQWASHLWEDTSCYVDGTPLSRGKGERKVPGQGQAKIMCPFCDMARWQTGRQPPDLKVWLPPPDTSAA